LFEVSEEIPYIFLCPKVFLDLENISQTELALWGSHG